MPTPQFLAEPAIEHGPEHAPLVARMSMKTSGADETRVRIEQNGDAWTITFPATDGRCLLAGFHPEGEARLAVQVAGQDGAATWRKPLAHRLKDVPASPPEMPPLQTHVFQPHRMAGRSTFATGCRRAFGRITDMSAAQRKRYTHRGMLIAVDNCGRMRWMRNLGRHAARMEQSANGTLIVHDTDPSSGRIDVAGDVIRTRYAARRPQEAEEGRIPVDARSQHHQPHQMPNGSILALSAHARRMNDWPASVRDPDNSRAGRDIVGDMVVEVTPEGEVVWSWDGCDHLDPYRIGCDALDAYWHVRGFPGAADRTHGNGVAYDESDDSVLVSLRPQDCMLKIDRKSGETVWILGDHDRWPARLQGKLLTPLGENFRWPWHMHNPRITSKGAIVLVHNGIYGARPGNERIPFHKSFSRGVAYRVDKDAMSVEQVWSSALTDADVKERAWTMGDAHRPEDGDTALVIHSPAMPHGRDDIGMDEDDRSQRYVSEFPSHARILECSRKDIGDIVFDMTVRDEDGLIHFEVFSGVRGDSLYPEDSGIKLDLCDTLQPEDAA